MTNVRGEPVFSVMAAGWLCERSGWIEKVEDVKPGLLKTKRISTGNNFEEEDFYPGRNIPRVCFIYDRTSPGSRV